jgi:hypothetical protein
VLEFSISRYILKHVGGRRTQALASATTRAHANSYTCTRGQVAGTVADAQHAEFDGDDECVELVFVYQHLAAFVLPRLLLGL